MNTDSTSVPIAQVRTVAPRKSLPGLRAMTGGLLVTVAAIAAYVAATGATGDHRVMVVIAAQDIPAGTQLVASDLTTTKMQLSTTEASHTAGSPSRFLATTTLGPIKAGELVQTGNLEPTNSTAAKPEISVSIPIARALGGNLRSGDRVDIVETDKASGSITHTAVSDAEIVTTTQNSGSVGQDSDLIVTFAVPSRDDATAIASANDQGSITLIRTTGLQSE